MNKTNILKIANNIFNNITPINDNLYKGELFIGSNKPAGIYYFDFGDDIKKMDFKDYQENLLSKEYYSNNSNNLQWNYYLLLFQDDLDKGKKLEIEKNDRYARKFIFTESEFKDYFKLEPSSNIIESNIVFDWKAKLDEVGLQEVYGTSKITPAADRFFLNKTIDPKERPGKLKENNDVLKIDFIQRLILTDGYRPYLKKKDFEFGKVNLIKGINGSGKTSLLEAIELMLCGKSKRNPDTDESVDSIEAIYNNSRTKEKYIPKEFEFYRKRDLFWYSNNYATKNLLYQSFNRFNFYNSDAAYNFSNGDKKEIKEALFNLVLGPEYNNIIERTDKFLGHIKPEFNRLDKEITNFKNTIIVSDKTIKSLNQSNNVNIIVQKIVENIYDLKIKTPIEDVEKNYLIAEELCNRVATMIEKIRENSNSVDSVKNFKDQFAICKHQQEIFEIASKKFIKVETEVIQNQFIQSEVSQKLSLITDCIKYFSDKRLFNIENFKIRYDQTIQRINKIKEVNEKLGNVELATYKSNDSLFDYSSKKLELLKIITSEKSLIENELKERLAKLDSIEKIIKEIKFLGIEFLKNSNNSTICPLCQSHFTETELKSRIESISEKEDTVEAGQMQIQYEKQIELDKKILEINEQVNIINNIQSSYLILSPDQDVNLKSLSDITSYLENIKSEENSLNILKKEFDDLNELMSSYNVSENEFINLKKHIKETFENLDFVYSNKEKFEEKHKSLLSEFEEKKNVLDKLTKQKIDIEISLKKDLAIESDTKFDLNSLKKLFQDKESKLTRIKECFDRILEILDINEEDTIDNLDLTINILIKNLNSLKVELKNQFEIENAKNAKQTAENFINNNKVKYDRLKAGKAILDSIMSVNGNKELETFFNNNLKEIVDIFKTIHVPKEFLNIKFDESELYLIDFDGKERKITEISSGQRSALALSIFISLNRKLNNGPNIIMFDDPVSLIDDFNVLSFLDFLRYFMIKDKQIFLATANTKLASLFEKKFRFLGDDFKLIDMEIG